MPLFEFPELFITQLALVALGVYWLLKRNDEIPLLINTFLLYCGSYRFWAVTTGVSRGWVSLGNFGFASIDNERALIALAYIVFGQVCLTFAYVAYQRRRLPSWDVGAVSCPLSTKGINLTLLMGLACIGLTLVVRSRIIALVRSGASLGFQVSGYLYLFPFALVGVACVVLGIWKFGGFRSLRSKILAGFILVNVAQLTFGPSGRFQFLGWLVAAGVILSVNYLPRRRLVTLSILAMVAISLFAIAGALRTPTLAATNLNQTAWERAFSAEDANMLDGFVLSQQVYPERLPYSMGMEHLEILMRPIPRALWPGKPVGGYMNKLGLITEQSGFTLGISPTLFGSFYAEGALLGIFIFSVTYAYIFARLVKYSTRLHPFSGTLIRAMLCALLIPLLRGGDLPGVYAWIGMAFWPCFLVLWIVQRRQAMLTQQAALGNYVQPASRT